MRALLTFFVLVSSVLVSSGLSQIAQYPYPTGGSGGCVSYDSTRSVVWYAVESPTNLCKVNSSGSSTCFTAPSNVSTGGCAYSSSDDRVYLVLQNVSGTDQIVQFNPNTSTFTATWNVPEGAAGTAGIIPFNGKLYCVETSTNKVCNVSLAGAFGTSISVGTFPHGPSIGPNGNLRFVLFNGNQIGQLTASGTYTAVTLPQSNSHPGTTTPCTYQGSAGICFTINSLNQIGFIPDSNQTTGGVVTINVPSASADVWGTATGADGNVYFGERASNKIGMLNVTSGTVTNEWALPNGGTSPNKLCLAFSNNLVFTEHVTTNIDVLNTKPVSGGSSVTGAMTGIVQ